jgi:alkanesulfonate monooxygenase SsuD/methylene tetrahydromethanopterin reductase-like flavin-dependent oxidoreductase (luciferase family)
MFEIGFFVQQDNHVTEIVNQSQGPIFYLKGASIAEELGYDSFWLPDHWLQPNDVAVLDCWSVLAAVAATTKKIKLGSLVTPVTAHSPFLLAKRAVTVQMIAQGRLQLGLGAGWYRQEYVAAGISFDSHRVRLEKLEETIQFLQLLWKSKNPINFRGRHYAGSQVLLRPDVEKPPLWLGGSSDKLLEYVGRYADGWIPFEMHHDSMVDRTAQLHGLMDKAGRKTSDVVIGHATRVVAGKTKQEAIEICRRLGIQRDYTATDLPKGVRAHMIVGSFEECTTELANLVDAGVNHMVLSPQPSDHTHELLVTYKDEIFGKLR